MQESTKDLSSYLSTERVFFLDSETKEGAIQEIIDHLTVLGDIEHPKAFFEAICKREELASTGIGFRIAIPHAKLHEGKDFVVGIGVKLDDLIDWKAIDHQRVQIIFLIGGPPSQNQEYLQLLSQLTQILRDESLRNSLLLQTDAPGIIDILCSYWVSNTER